jgi:hypothetical protein
MVGAGKSGKISVFPALLPFLPIVETLHATSLRQMLYLQKTDARNRRLYANQPGIQWRNTSEKTGANRSGVSTYVKKFKFSLQTLSQM